MVRGQETEYLIYAYTIHARYSLLLYLPKAPSGSLCEGTAVDSKGGWDLVSLRKGLLGARATCWSEIALSEWVQKQVQLVMAGLFFKLTF